MVDSANILMQQYQGIIARLPPPIQVLTPVPETAAENVPNIVPVATAAAEAPLAEPVPAVSSPTSCDKPSTSRAAAAVAAGDKQQVSVASSNPVSEKVTIEDLGAEEDVVLSTNAACGDVDNEDSSELSELRKRRLKFLEERNKSPTSSDQTD